ncbi:MAG: hypothetical protein JSR78_16260, partial [Proteobacteria bacterium]|nr:hypothetical protein [Pseudomonadota bacterium]
MLGRHHGYRLCMSGQVVWAPTCEPWTVVRVLDYRQGRAALDVDTQGNDAGTR